MGSKRPTREFMFGRIRTAIWANETEGQEVWFNVTVARRYKDNGGWKDTSSFHRDDLPVVSKALDMAFGWILRREQKLKSSPPAATEKEG